MPGSGFNGRQHHLSTEQLLEDVVDQYLPGTLDDVVHGRRVDEHIGRPFANFGQAGQVGKLGGADELVQFEAGALQLFVELMAPAVEDSGKLLLQLVDRSGQAGTPLGQNGVQLSRDMLDLKARGQLTGGPLHNRPPQPLLAAHHRGGRIA